VWNQFKFVETDLKLLYKSRAEYLREKYKYLILNYSAGADSHNVLKTFLDNDIRLDAVHVKWPKVSHTVSNSIRPENLLSEWELTIKPALTELSSKFPEVKIYHSDWSEKINHNLVSYPNFEKINHFTSLGDYARITSLSNFEKRDDVGQIWGIDKPLVYLDNDDLGFYFRDETICVGQTLKFDLSNIEFFYWSPDDPTILFGQLTKVFKFLSSNESSRKFFPSRDWEQLSEYKKFEYLEIQRKLLIWLLYEDKNYKFQSLKSETQNKEDWDFWIYKEVDLVNIWKYHQKAMLSEIDQRFCFVKGQREKISFLPIRTKIFQMGKLNLHI
jgi:hypothetical protein